MLLWINRVLVVLIIVMLIVAGSVFYIFYCKNTLQAVHTHYYNLLPVSFQAETPQNNDEIIKILNNEFRVDYILYYTNFESDCINGRVTIIFNIIEIDEKLNGEMFVIVLTHELVHLKYNTCDERFANFYTFLSLYESSNQYLNYCALVFANMIFSHSVYCSAYDCCYYISNYLNLI